MDVQAKLLQHAPLFLDYRNQILSSCIHVFGASILSFCFARRIQGEHLCSRHGWAELTWSKFFILFLFLDSWFFLAFTGVLVHGVGLNYSTNICSLGILSCIVFYASSKVLIYLFLVERVWVVWRPSPSAKRLRSPVFRICISVLAGYVVIIVLMVLGRRAFIDSHGTCIIGLEYFASITLVAYDLFVNCLLTFMFVYPLFKRNFKSCGLRRLAIRTLVAATAALLTSSVNMSILIALKGKQFGWLCLGSCGADVTINALVLYWVTSCKHRESANESSTPQFPVGQYPRRDHRETKILSGNLRSPVIPGSSVRHGIHLPELVEVSPNGPTTPISADMRDSFKKFLEDSYDKMHGSSVGVVSEPMRAYSGVAEWTPRIREPGRFVRTAGSVIRFASRDSDRLRLQTQSLQNGVTVTVDIEHDFDEIVDGTPFSIVDSEDCSPV